MPKISSGRPQPPEWIGGESWSTRSELDRLFAESKGEDAGTGVGDAPPETIAIWLKIVATMGPDELDSFDERTFRQWEPASLGAVRRAIERRRKDLGTR